MGAAELSEALYGDAAHLVTVRAELSRLRRILGSYRIAPGVRLQLPEPRGCGFVARSTAPGILALAR